MERSDLFIAIMKSQSQIAASSVPPSSASSQARRAMAWWGEAAGRGDGRPPSAIAARRRISIARPAAATAANILSERVESLWRIFRHVNSGMGHLKRSSAKG